MFSVIIGSVSSFDLKQQLVSNEFNMVPYWLMQDFHTKLQ